MNAKIRGYNEVRRKAAAATWWWNVGGEWKRLTNAESRKAVAKAIQAGVSVRKATTDEELDLEGI
jgi:hypothetical protein